MKCSAPEQLAPQHRAYQPWKASTPVTAACTQSQRAGEEDEERCSRLRDAGLLELGALLGRVGRHFTSKTTAVGETVGETFKFFLLEIGYDSGPFAISGSSIAVARGTNGDETS